MEMKFFQTIRTRLALFGFQEDLEPFNKRQKWIYVPCLSFHICNAVQLFHVASTTKEVMDAIFVNGVGTLITVSHTCSIVKMKTIFVLMNEIQEGINSSKSKRFFFLTVTFTV